MAQESDRYDAAEDNDCLLSEEGVSQSSSSRSRFRQAGAVLLLGGTAVAGALAMKSSRTPAAGKVSSKVGLQAAYGYGVDTATGAYTDNSAYYGQSAYGNAVADPSYDAYGASADPYANSAGMYAQAAAQPAAPAAAAYAPAAAAYPPLPTGGPCGGPGDNCLGSQCCKDAGYQCFSKNRDYGTCRASCQAGMAEKGEPWDCFPLGEPAPIPDGPVHCAWSGDNCIATKCCNDANMKCFKKDEYFAGCLFKPSEGWDNAVIGEFRGWHQAYAGGGAGPFLGTKLYCIAVKSPNARVHEEKLLAAAAAKNIGIFSCNDHSIYEGAVAAKTEWKSISNTDIFIGVWNQVIEDGLFWNNDWTIKADPDCVFFGERLQWHFEKMNIGKYDAVYIKNCDFKFRFQGSLEVFSMKAIEKYKEYRGMCGDKIGHEGGEDFWMMTCMDAMGVWAVEDDSILYDKYATGEHLVLDDVSSCHNGWTAAFHPFRSVDAWNDCAVAALSVPRSQ